MDKNILLLWSYLSYLWKTCLHGSQVQWMKTCGFQLNDIQEPRCQLWNYSWPFFQRLYSLTRPEPRLEEHGPMLVMGVVTTSSLQSRLRPLKTTGHIETPHSPPGRDLTQELWPHPLPPHASHQKLGSIRTCLSIPESYGWLQLRLFSFYPALWTLWLCLLLCFQVGHTYLVSIQAFVESPCWGY